jgi:hypothetical protein
MDDSDGLRANPVAAGDAAQEEKRKATRHGRVAMGTLACSRCDAPIALTAGPVTLTETLSCPFCAHQAPVRDFLSLRAPTRPTRVEVRVVTRVGTRVAASR